ncbi:MAG TPA: ABC transporter substrate-binding protein [Thermomicrobiales bacterium]|nr:ABC transporter substrate-binding protein [Thermomicrobiales bacterium]
MTTSPSSPRADRTPILSRRSLMQTTGAFAIAPVILGGGTRIAAGQEATPGAGATPALEPVPGGRLRIGLQGDPTELDPALTNLNAAGLVVDLVYEGLAHEAPDLTPQPALAESWTISDDLLTYTFKLRPGVKFHNGREFVADDVKYSFERIQNPDNASPWQTFLSGVASIETPDPATVVIVLTAPDASFLARLCTRGLVIVPKEEVEKNGDLMQTMVGTGPFVFKEYVPSSSMTLDKNPEYWDAGKPYLDGLDLTIVPEDTQRTAALISKTVDLIEQVGQKDISLIEKESSLTLVGGATTNLRWIVFNLRRKPFDSLEFRQAVFAAIDRGPIIDAAVFGYGEPLVGLYPTSYWAGFHGEIPAPDPDKAKELLGKVELPDGFRPKILTWAAYKFLSDTSVVVQEQLKQIGIESEIDPQENAIYLEQYFGGDFDIAVMGASGYIDPNDWMQQSLMTGAENNAAGYSSAEFDKLVQQGLETPEQADRAEIYQQAQQLLIDDLPWISLYNSESYVGMSTSVQGFVFYLSSSFYALRETWLQG